MTTCLRKNCSIGLPCASFLNVYQCVCVFLSLLDLKMGFGILIVLVPGLCLSFNIASYDANMHDGIMQVVNFDTWNTPLENLKPQFQIVSSIQDRILYAHEV